MLQRIGNDLVDNEPAGDSLVDSNTQIFCIYAHFNFPLPMNLNQARRKFFNILPKIAVIVKIVVALTDAIRHSSSRPPKQLLYASTDSV